MNETRDPRPASYGDEERARHYVKSLLANGPQSGPVYLIVAPAFRANKVLWPKLLKRLRDLLPGVQFRLWDQVRDDAARSPGTHSDFIRDSHAGGILIGARHHHMIRTGPVALAESTGFAAAGKPMLVFSGARLIAWPDCQVVKIPEESRKDDRTAAYVIMPTRPDGNPLPTLAASLRALGIRDPQVIARAAGLGPQEPRRGSERQSAGYGNPSRTRAWVRSSKGSSEPTEGR